MFNLQDFCDEVAAWTGYNFPDAQPWEPLMGVSEEVGELCHAHLKGRQKVRGGAQESHVIHRAKVDAVGDIMVFLTHYCELSGIDLQDAIQRTWAEVQKRDWVKYPGTGRPPKDEPTEDKPTEGEPTKEWPTCEAGLTGLQVSQVQDLISLSVFPEARSPGLVCPLPGYGSVRSR